jgi:hypothetical protein
MNDLRSCLARLAMVGLCVSWVGCGGGDAPDAGSENLGAVDAPAPPVDAPAAPAKEEGGEVAKADGAVAAPAPGGDNVAAAEDKPGEDKPGAATKGDSTGTTELFNMANNAPPPPDPPAVSDAAPNTPGGPGGSGGMNPGGMRPGMMTQNGAGGSGGMRGTRGSGMDQEGGPGGSGAIGGLAGMAGMRMGGGGGSGYGMGGNDTNAPANYTLPLTAVTTFLNAVKSKNKDRIADATALRSVREAHSKSMKQLFSNILDNSISDEDVNDLAKQLEGYSIIGQNTAVSSGQLGIILGKSNGNYGQYRRTITVRHEAKGWKVSDITGRSELEGMRGVRLPGMGRMPGRRR